MGRNQMLKWLTWRGGRGTATGCGRWLPWWAGVVAVWRGQEKDRTQLASGPCWAAAVFRKRAHGVDKKDRTRLASGPCWAAAVFRVHSAPLKPLSMAAGRWHMFAHEDGRCQSNSKKHSACRMLLAEAELDNSLGSGGPGEVGPGWPGGRAQGGPGRWAQGGLGLRVVQPGFSKQHATCKMQVES